MCKACKARPFGTRGATAITIFMGRSQRPSKPIILILIANLIPQISNRERCALNAKPPFRQIANPRPAPTQVPPNVITMRDETSTNQRRRKKTTLHTYLEKISTSRLRVEGKNEKKRRMNICAAQSVANSFLVFVFCAEREVAQISLYCVAEEPPKEKNFGGTSPLLWSS
jgi:hypothetical protein